MDFSFGLSKNCNCENGKLYDGGRILKMCGYNQTLVPLAPNFPWAFLS